MCYFTQQGKLASELTDYYGKDIDNPANLLQSDFINGFSYPNIPIVLDSQPEIITTNYTWGLLPDNKKKDFRKSTLNARVESLEEKMSFAPSINKRCLVIVSAYFDWHWNDPLGKTKTKFKIHSTVDEIFYLAGLYNSWQDTNGEIWNTYSIVTTEADEKMKYIHNRKEAEGDQRMPIIINRSDEQEWLDSKNHPLNFSFPAYKPSIFAL